MYERLLLQFLPCAMCLIGMALVLLRRYDRIATKELAVALAIAAIYWAVDVNYVNPLTNPSSFLAIAIIGTVTALSLPPCLIMWQHVQMGFRSFRWYEYVFMALPTAFFLASSLIMCLVVSGENFERMLDVVYLNAHPVFEEDMASMKWSYEVNYTAFMIMIGVEITVAIGCFVRDAVLLLRLKERNSYENKVLYSVLAILVLLIIALIRVCVGHVWMIEHPFITSVLSLCVAVCIFIAWYALLLMGNREERIAETHATPSQVFSLKEQFERLMILEGWCYKSDLKQEDITDALGISYPYLRYMLKEIYQTDYVSWVRRIRIHKAKEWMRKFPAMSMDEVAEKVGYSGAPAFNKVFKQVEGITPKAWLKSVDFAPLSKN